jgi:arylsulfatase A-like enzyme
MKKYINLLFLLITVLAIACNKSNNSTYKSLDNYNVLLIIVDTLGAKYTSIYNNELDTTPNLKKLGEQSIVFENAYSSSSWTKPSLASAFTSLYPSQHKANKLYVALDQSFETLAERMKERGYNTVGYVSHTMLSKTNGFTQGFDEYQISKMHRHPHFSIASDQVTDMAIKWLNEKSDSKFFMMLHYFDPHYSYLHHPQFDYSSWYKGNVKAGENFRKLRDNSKNYSKDDIKYITDLYKEEIKFTDYHIGKLLEEVQKKNLDKNTLIIFMADHGEEFLEHKSMGHSHTLYNELTKVPFFFKLPNNSTGKRVVSPVSTIDLMPTIEGLFSNPNPRPYWQGVSHSQVLINNRDVINRPIISELSYDSPRTPPAHKVSVVVDDDKLIYDKISKDLELYNLYKDPNELNKTNDAEKINTLNKHIKDFLELVEKPVDQSLKPAEETKRSDEEIKQLKSLGYL